LDGSEAVEVAAHTLQTHPNVGVIKADLRAAPFDRESFGFISCLGVLHHLSDPEDGLRELVSLLEPGGLIVLYIYSRPSGHGVRAIGLAGASLLRRVTVRMPRRPLRVVALGVAAALYAAVVTPGRLGGQSGFAPLANLPLAVYRGQPLRSLWLDTFDRLSAPIERRYVWSELEQWFVRTGLVVASIREEAGWHIVARRL
jgi:SAM-dependent methyltransferase